jgi:predicted SnoaL-like aldol condensation-catalyzing enzyme
MATNSTTISPTTTTSPAKRTKSDNNNKQSAISFLQLAGTGEVKTAYEKYISSSFIHHNQHFKGTRQDLMDAMQDAHQKSPNKMIEVKHCYEDGNTVITHSLVTRKEENAQPIVVIHIFKFNEDGLVVELWDVGQLVMKDSPNENGVL